MQGRLCKTEKEFPPSAAWPLVLFFLDLFSSPGRLILARLWGLVPSTGHGESEGVPPVCRFTARLKVNNGEGCLVELLSYFGDQVTVKGSNK